MEKGPIYGVELIDTLPLGTGPMKQAMPSAKDLKEARFTNERTVAGYEVLLDRYRDVVGELAELKDFLAYVRETVGDECDCDLEKIALGGGDPCIFCAVRAAWEANKED